MFQDRRISFPRECFRVSRAQSMPLNALFPFLLGLF